MNRSERMNQMIEDNERARIENEPTGWVAVFFENTRTKVQRVFFTTVMLTIASIILYTISAFATSVIWMIMGFFTGMFSIGGYIYCVTKWIEKGEPEKKERTGYY